MRHIAIIGSGPAGYYTPKADIHEPTKLANGRRGTRT